MTETINIPENMEQPETAEAAVKPYTFRKLSGDDMFLMFSIIKKIGLKEFKQCFEGDNIKGLVEAFTKSKDGENAEESGNNDKSIMSIGFAVGFDALDVILGNLPKCKEGIYQLLSQTSNLSEDVIRADALLLTEMIIDFFKKEEFPAFIKVVSKLFK